MSRAHLPVLSLPQALKILSTFSGFSEADVIRDPDYTCELAAMRLIDARNVVRASKDAKKNGTR